MGSLTQRHEGEVTAKRRRDEAKAAFDAAERRVGTAKTAVREVERQRRRTPDRARLKIEGLAQAAEERLQVAIRDFLPSLETNEPAPAQPAAELVAAYVLAREPGLIEAIREEVTAAAADPGDASLGPSDAQLDAERARRNEEVAERERELEQAREALTQADENLDAVRRG